MKKVKIPLQKIQGFTLIEVMLTLGVITLASVGIYAIYRVSSDWSIASNESKVLHSVINQVERGTNATGLMTGIDKTTLKNFDSGFVSNMGLEDVVSPTPKVLNFVYKNVSSRVCGDFVRKMLQGQSNISAVINSENIANGTDPVLVGGHCKLDSNNVTIVVNNEANSNAIVAVVPTALLVAAAPAPAPAPTFVSPTPAPTPAPASVPPAPIPFTPTPAPGPSPSPFTPIPAPAMVPMPTPAPTPTPAPSPSTPVPPFVPVIIIPPPPPPPVPAPAPTPAPVPSPPPGPPPPAVYVNYDSGMGCTSYVRGDNIFGGVFCQSYVEFVTTICPTGSAQVTWFQTISYKADYSYDGTGLGFNIGYFTLPYVVAVTDNSSIFCYI